MSITFTVSAPESAPQQVMGLQNCLPGKMYSYAGNYFVVREDEAPVFPTVGAFSKVPASLRYWENVVAFGEDSLFFVPTGKNWFGVILTEVPAGTQLTFTAK